MEGYERPARVGSGPRRTSSVLRLGTARDAVRRRRSAASSTDAAAVGGGPGGDTTGRLAACLRGQIWCLGRRIRRSRGLICAAGNRVHDDGDGSGLGPSGMGAACCGGPAAQHRYGEETTMRCWRSA
ncbi:hypothetical protein PVAP13_6KG257500 [Panicum virgatum]|uniref:Uncharacterized protein n=1 Tax=Panicum virgatum TaxID=38727 RepID=A0A8T0RGU2_PANVG|nr:hypothetical protein PVAP13_6KG257500 [Panicum virgatum]